MQVLADESRLNDGEGEDLSSSDIEPAGAVDDTDSLHDLIATAKRLQGKAGDPKLTALMAHLQELVNDSFRPVVFCRYVATAHYVAEHVKAHFKKASVDAITGEFTPEEREIRVRTLGEEDQPILIATDCLSEGINLQEGFNAVIHYDLAWNPTRHEQREGRVDRFGQKAPEVRCTMLWGQDNPVDGFILNVIIRKARDIQRELGVLVPLPQDEKRINQAMIKAALLKRNRQGSSQKQMELSLEEITESLNPLKTEWEDAYEKAKANRTVFAQRRLTPEDVLPDWEKQLKLIGDEHSIERFVKNACARLNSPLEQAKKGWRFLPQHLPQALRERLKQEGIEKEIAIDFHYPPSSQTQFIHRTHPLVAVLADSLLETALQEASPVATRFA
jgi:superfamily II DNA/RNA helicase